MVVPIWMKTTVRTTVKMIPLTIGTNIENDSAKSVDNT